MSKQTITQRDFMLGALRPGFLEGDDLELRGKSLREARNMRVEATRSLRDRPGTFLVRDLAGSYDIIEIRPKTGEVYGLLIRDSGLDVIDAQGRSLWSLSPAPWSSGADVWVEPFSETTVIGGSWGIKKLVYDAGTWSFQDFDFARAAGNSVAQPYWVFHKGVTITPSATTGTITITASAAVFTPQYVGLRIRYGEREILITGFTSPSVLVGVVQSPLPPSWSLFVGDASSINVGDAVIGQVTDFQGVVVGKTSNTISVVTTEFFEGPDNGEKLSAPSGTVTVSFKQTIAPLPSSIWDEPLISPIRGYPRAGASAGGRLTLVDFPQVPDAICLSSTRDINDFEIGASDDDAILRQAGENTPRFLHVLNAGDLLLFSDKGIYYVELRSGNLITPTSFNPVQFDRRAASAVRPVAIDDGAAFVEASGQTIASCRLTGNVNLRWTVRSISIYHDQLINAPVKLCGPSLYSVSPEKYLFVVNRDGTLAAMSWFEEFSMETIGFLRWDTQGRFVSISPIFGGHWMIVDRDLSAGTIRTIERLSEDAVVDCSCAVTPPSPLLLNGSPLEVNGQELSIVTSGAALLEGQTVQLVGNGWYGGPRVVDPGGAVPDVEGYPSGAYIGLDFAVSCKPWPVEVINSPRAGMLKARVIRGSISVKDTLTASVRANNSTKRFGGHSFGDDLSAPAPLMTRVLKFSVVGHRDHPEIEISRTVPGPIKVLAITQEVQV